MIAKGGIKVKTKKALSKDRAIYLQEQLSE
jgi:hypothetical protein